MCQYICELLFIQLLHKQCLLLYCFDVVVFFFGAIQHMWEIK